MADGQKPPSGTVFGGSRVSIHDLGKDEIWLQSWLAEDASRLGLGEVKILAQELTQTGGGSLDILATDGDTYYSVEVQLGEVDASHGFRVFDYWARNRQRYPDKNHVGVLVSESASGRYGHALKALAEYLPFLVIELRAWKGQDEAIVTPEVVVANTSLDLSSTSAGKGEAAWTADEWREQCTPEAWQFHTVFVKWVKDTLGDVRVDYSPKSYIGVRRGRRVWAPLWPTKDGATVHLPDPDGSKSEQSVAFEWFQEQLRGVGLSPSWTSTYNAGANPIALRLRQEDLADHAVQELLRASWEILDPGAKLFSESHPAEVGGVVASGPPSPPTTDEALSPGVGEAAGPE